MTFSSVKQGKTKVVHIITRMILGGAQENTLFTCEGLHADPGWDVSLVTGPTRGPEGELMSRAKKHGLHTIELSALQRAINPLKEWKAFKDTVCLLREIDPLIVHTHSSKAGFIGRLAARAARIPIIIHTIHGLPFHRFLSPIPNAVFIGAEKLGAQCCDRLICVADAMAEQALEAGVGVPDQYATIHSGMEVDLYQQAEKHRESARQQLGIPQDATVIGKIARLFPLKGHKFVLQAAATIVEQCPQVRFLFVGNGILRDKLERQARELGIDDHIIFAGLVDSARIPEMIGAMDVLVHASLREGLPRAIVQALLGGRPVVSYDIDGAPEVVINDVTGYLVPPKSIEGLSQSLIKLVQNPEKARAMGREGQKRFSDEFRTETMVRKIKKVYREEMNRIDSSRIGQS